MSCALSPGSRVTTNDSPEGLEIAITAPRNLLLAGFLALWLAGWAAGESFALRALLGIAPAAGRAFLLLWLAFWTLGGAAALWTCAWTLAGRERLVLRPDALTVRYEVLGIGPARSYALDGISNLRVMDVPALAGAALPAGLPPPDPGRLGAVFVVTGTRGGGIAFDCAGRFVRLGLALDAGEARQVVSLLRARHGFS